ncbi:MAG: YraN family protein [Clostridia bacterium]|nr:YraN family protein [Clostridia bacterium]
MRNKNQILGAVGEAKAVNFLKNNGYKILATNFVTFAGEIDIIAKQKFDYIFVEVKNRSSYAFGLPQNAVNYKKQKNIKNSADIFFKLNKISDPNYRFDIIEIVCDEINHIEGAF